MGWNEQIFRYCERGQDPAFWAEPFNALSNAGFLVAAALLWRRLRNGPVADGVMASSYQGGHQRDLNWMAVALVLMTAAVGVGSFLFHTFATRWSRLADVIPISVFMAGYLAFALRVFLGWSLGRVLLALLGFGIIGVAASSLACPASMSSVTDYAREPCLKGTMGYVPALLALLVTGAAVRHQPAIGRRLLVATGLFAAAMILRWLDRSVCTETVLFGQGRGTHALWHLLSAATLYVLVAAASDAAASPRVDRGRSRVKG